VAATPITIIITQLRGKPTFRAQDLMIGNREVEGRVTASLPARRPDIQRAATGLLK